MDFCAPTFLFILYAGKMRWLITGKPDRQVSLQLLATWQEYILCKGLCIFCYKRQGGKMVRHPGRCPNSSFILPRQESLDTKQHLTSSSLMDVGVFRYQL